jgi:hypothetical protein
MTSTGPPGSASGSRVAVVAGRLWAGGAAAGCVAALVAAFGVLLCSTILDVSLAEPALVLPISDSLALNYACSAFLLALAATGLAHLLSITTPRPRSFFSWIVGLVTLAAMAAPFALEGDLADKIGTALINLAIGIAIGTLLTAVLSRTVTDAERSWQRP